MKKYISLVLLGATILFAGCSSSDDSLKLERLSNLPLAGGLTDVWGYIDAVSQKEYAIVGFGGFRVAADAGSGFYIIDVSDPKRPEQVAMINTVPGFDVKVWQHYVYAVDGNSGGQAAIVDISDVSAPTVVGNFPTSHNIFISDNGLMFLETASSPQRIYDLSAPTSPRLLWQGGQGGHDATVIGNRWYDFAEGASTNIFDISQPNNPRLLGAITAPFIAFHHSGWPTEDGRHLFICDELADRNGVPADITVWDISDVGDPAKVGEFADPGSSVHNLYVVGDYAFVSYYTAGFRVFDVSDPAQPKVVKSFDTSQLSGPVVFAGAFGVYPFAPDGKIYVSDTGSGLHVFRFSGLLDSGSQSPLAP